MIWEIVAAVFVVAFGLSYKAAKDAQKAAKRAQDAMSGVLVNKESNIEAIPVIYGVRRVGGVRVFVDTESLAGGNKNKYLYMALTLAEGEVDDIYDIKLDDYSIFDDRFGNIQRRNELDQSERIIYSDSNTANELVYIEAYKGRDDQTASSILSLNAKWGAEYRLRGVAYLAIRLKWDEDLFSGMPEITAIVKGRKVYDPRTTVTAWSDNPALCLRDYLINPRFGKGLPTSAINDTAFIAAANDCDTFTVTPYAGGPSGHRIFKTNAVLDTSEELFRNAEKLLLGCRGFLPYTQGQYALYIDQATTAVMTLTTNEIIGGIRIAGERKNEKFNRVNIKFPNPNTEWEPDQATWPDAGSAEETAFQAADGGTLLVDEIDMDTITDYYAARDFARIFVLRSRNALRCALKATSEALDLTVGDVVNITHPTPGWTAKPFQVEAVSLGYDGTVQLNCVEYDSTLYAYDPASEETTYPDTDLPDPFTIEPPTNLVAVASTRVAEDGTVVPIIAVTWTEPDNAFVSSYDVQWKRVADTNYNSYRSFESSHDIYNADVGQNYDIRIRSVSAIGARSAFIAIQFVPTGDLTAPSPPTSLSAVGGLREIGLTWTLPPERDYAHSLVFENTVDNSATAAQIAVAAGGNYTRTGLGYGVTRYYWVKAVDHSGNVSGFSTVATAATDFVGSDAFTQEVYDLFDNANVNQIEIFATLPATGEYVGQVIFLTADNKLYRWTGTEWTAAVATGDLVGTITETQIADDAISTPKLQANAVTANEIAGGTITGDKIVANTITGGLLATAGIITTTAQIENSVITNANIINAAISTLKIQDDAVTIPSGQDFAALNTNITGLTFADVHGMTVDWGPNWADVNSVIVVGSMIIDGVLGSNASPQAVFMRLTQKVNDSPRGQVQFSPDRPGRPISVCTTGKFPGPSQQTVTYYLQTATDYFSLSGGYWKNGRGTISAIGAKK